MTRPPGSQRSAPGSRLPCPDALKQPLSSVQLPLPGDAKVHARNVYAKLRNHTPLVRALDLLCLFGEPAKEEWGAAWGGEATLVLSWYLRSPKKVALTGVKLSDYLAYAPATLGQVPRTFATLDAIQKENA